MSFVVEFSTYFPDAVDTVTIKPWLTELLAYDVGVRNQPVWRTESRTVLTDESLSESTDTASAVVCTAQFCFCDGDRSSATTVHRRCNVPTG